MTDSPWANQGRGATAAQAGRARGRRGRRSEKDPKLAQIWANFSLLSLYSHRNAWANLHLLGQPNTLLARGAGGPAPLRTQSVDGRKRRCLHRGTREPDNAHRSINTHLARSPRLNYGPAA
jgi:hypothetical protein